MSEETYLKLQHSESVVAHMASRILSAYITSGQLSETNEDELIARSLALAIKLAEKTDKTIDSDNESTE
jgi:hypothetical protein